MLEILETAKMIATRDLPTFVKYLTIPVAIEAAFIFYFLRTKVSLREGPKTIFIGIVEVLITGTVLFYLRDLFKAIESVRPWTYTGEKGPVYWGVVFLIGEFVFYANHRLSHECRWFWNEHRVHHSSRDMNLFVGNRNGWTFAIAGIWMTAMPVVYLGLDWFDFIQMIFAILQYQFFVHTTAVKTLGPLEYILNTPSIHRIHHATEDPYLDKNYGGVTLLFDYAFGTLQRELPGIPPTYGLRNEPDDQSVRHLVFGGWIAMFRDFRRAKGARAKFRTLYDMRKAGITRATVAGRVPESVDQAA